MYVLCMHGADGTLRVDEPRGTLIACTLQRKIAKFKLEARGGAMISLPPTKLPAGDLPGGRCEESRWRASCAWPRAQAAHVKHVAITSICGS